MNKKQGVFWLDVELAGFEIPTELNVDTEFFGNVPHTSYELASFELPMGLQEMVEYGIIDENALTEYLVEGAITLLEDM